MSVFYIPTLIENYRFHVYAMLCQDGDGPGYVKFGHSKRIGMRLNSLRTACPIPARYFAVVEVPGYKTMLNVERALHEQFKDRRISGEWFKFDFSSKEDKRAFNDGSRDVFMSIMGPDFEWWTKISVAALDAYNRERRNQFLRSKHKNKLMRKQARERQRKKDLKELDEWRNAS